ncbi:hypothetical protein JZO72_03815 [Vagococcus fluvialis]|uniref:hypothetical protein n=1 Tax=Vagococcus fluvialis TaxID=2738 RepID=UPI001A8C8B9D|nr:hypothetical protein [Vagococcus fluvialis]MBO0478748.1 hypothetical protein [Vagococcus fluvialis]MBO0484407.1 hypothetical protein [Vagococcus fluvialis]
MNLENRIMKSVTEYLESDKIETVVHEAMDKAVDELFNSYRGLGSIIKKTLEEQMTPIIESHDYSNFAIKLDYVLQSVLKEQAGETNKLLENFEGVVKPYPKSMTITDIFNEYCKHASLKVDTTELEVDYDDEPLYENITCNVTYTEQERSIYSSRDQSGILEFSCEQDESLEFSLSISKWSWEDNFHVNSDVTTKIDKLKYLSRFETFVLGLNLNNVDILLDDTDITDEDVEVEERPEPTY